MKSSITSITDHGVGVARMEEPASLVGTLFGSPIYSSFAQRDGCPIVSPAGSHSIPSLASLVPPDIQDPWIPRWCKFLSTPAKGSKYPRPHVGAVLFLFYLASFVLLCPGCVDVRDSRQRTLGARRHAPFVCSPAFREARTPHANK